MAFTQSFHSQKTPLKKQPTIPSDKIDTSIHPYKAASNIFISHIPLAMLVGRGWPFLPPVRHLIPGRHRGGLGHAELLRFTRETRSTGPEAVGLGELGVGHGWCWTWTLASCDLTKLFFVEKFGRNISVICHILIQYLYKREEVQQLEINESCAETCWAAP